MASWAHLIQCTKMMDLCDVWRNFHCVQRYTWAHAYNNVFSLARLNRFDCFKHQLRLFKGCLILPVVFSDHSQIQCTIILSSIKPKSAYWHLNMALIHDKCFREIFKVFWITFKAHKSSFKSLQQWWDKKVQI